MLPDCRCAFDKMEFKCEGKLPSFFKSSRKRIPLEIFRMAFSSINSLPSSDFTLILSGAINNDSLK